MVINGINRGVLIYNLVLCLRYTQVFSDIHPHTCCRKDKHKARDESCGKNSCKVIEERTGRERAQNTSRWRRINVEGRRMGK